MMQRKILFLGLLCVMVPAFVLAGTGPKIHFAAQEHDFGDVIHGESPSVELPFFNNGHKDLIIERIASSCGCAKAVRGSRTVPPGSSSKIFAQIDTFGMSPGKHAKTVVVHSNDPEHPVMALKLLFNVVRHVSIQPDTLATSVTNQDKVAVFSLEAINHWTQPVTLKAPKGSDADDVHVDPQEIVLQPGAKGRFQLSVRIGQEPQQPYLKGQVVIDTDDPLEKGLQVRYFIRFNPNRGT